MDKNLFGKCPYFTSQKLLSSKWALYILYLLSQDTLRFNELQRRIPEKITHTSLARQLKFLEKSGLVVRKEYTQVPPKVEYYLSDMGEEFKPVLDALGVWGKMYINTFTEK